MKVASVQPLSEQLCGSNSPSTWLLLHDSVRGPISRTYTMQIFLFVLATANGTLKQRKFKNDNNSHGALFCEATS